MNTITLQEMYKRKILSELLEFTKKKTSKNKNKNGLISTTNIKPQISNVESSYDA